MKQLAAPALVYGLIANIVVGMADAAIYGDGQFSKVSNGHYFLNQHGHYVEVSPAHFRFAHIQGATIIPSFLALAIIAGFIEQRRRKRKP